MASSLDLFHDFMHQLMAYAGTLCSVLKMSCEVSIDFESQRQVGRFSPERGRRE